MDRFIAENPRSKSEGKGAVGILSRFAIREAVNYAALDPRFSRGALGAIVRENDRNPGLAILGVQLSAGELIENEEARLTELEALMAAAKNYHGREHILAGDFNASHPQQVIDLAKARKKTQQRATSQGGEIPRQVVRRVLEHGYFDAHALHHEPAEFGKSFTTSHPALRVDYIFVTPGLAPRLKNCEVFETEIGRFASDHFPVIADLAP
jgi:endonuclease/exonuclease/phosphatase family metal-dependent hydrolase